MMNRFYSCLSLVVLIVLTASMLTFGCSMQKTDIDVATTSTEEGIPEDGINVHGHWIIEVINPDGFVVERREFDNAFNASVGNRLLANILSRQNCVGAWRIELFGSESSHFPFLDGTNPSTGWLLENTDTNYDLVSATGDNVFNTLTVSTNIEGDLELNGNAVAGRDGDIGRVATLLSLAPATQPPAVVYDNTEAGLFCQTYLETPIALVSGQQVIVKVLITFS